MNLKNLNNRGLELDLIKYLIKMHQHKRQMKILNL